MRGFALIHRWNLLCCCCLSVKLFLQFNLRRVGDSRGILECQWASTCTKASFFSERLHLFLCFLRRGLELGVIVIPLLQPPEFWDCRHVLLFLIYAMLGIEPTALCMPNKLSLELSVPISDSSLLGEVWHPCLTLGSSFTLP